MSRNLYNYSEEQEVHVVSPFANRAKKIGIFIVLLAVFSGMLAWGLGGFVNNSKEGYVAEIGSEVITEMHVDIEASRLQKKFPGQAMNPAMREFALHDLLLSKLLKREAKNLHLDITDKTIAKYIAHNKDFQGEKGFDKAKFESFLSSVNMTEHEYIERLKQKIVSDVIIGIIGLPKVNLSNLAEYKLKGDHQTRIVDMFVLPKQNASTVSVSEQELSDFYLSHKNLFTQKATATVNYISSDDILKKHQIKVTEKEVEDEFNKIYGGKYAEHRSLYMLVLSSQEDIDKATFLLKNRKKTFMEVSAIFNKKESDILVKDVSYFDLQSHVRDVVFSLPINKISDPIQISHDRIAIVQVNKITATKQDSIEKKKIMQGMSGVLLKQKSCEKVMILRDQIRDMVSSGKKITEIATAFNVPVLEVKTTQNSTGKFDTLLDKNDIYQGYTDIVEVDECSFDLIVIDKLEKFRNKEFSEAYFDVSKALKQSKAEELSLNIANETKSKLEKLDIKNISLMHNFASGGDMKFIRNFKISTRDHENQYLSEQIADNKIDDIAGPILLKDNSYAILIIKEIKNDPNYKKSDLEEVEADLWKQKQNDMQELYRQYLYKKYDVKIYK